MKKTIIFALISALLLIPFVYAQLSWEITDLRCGNGKLDAFELCEKGIDSPNYCDNLSTFLKIDTVCDTAHCTCLPRVNNAYCGNNKREGVEVCDGTGPDLCPEFGEAINLSLKCNENTCGCDLNENIPADYNPLIVEELENASQTASVCGDKKVERAEDCDPPDTLCTTDSGDPGICTQKCKCVEPSALDQPEEPEPDESELETNQSNEQNQAAEMNRSSSEVHIIEPEPVISESEPGFFKKLWAWIVGIFS